MTEAVKKTQSSIVSIAQEIEVKENNTSPKNTLLYRPDIDGLRAIAVLSVLFFHIFPSLVPGGYAGVDIFFVISGYLISSIVFKQLDAEIFSLLDFYKRRILRIFPALLLVLGATLLIGWFYLFRSEFTILGKYLGASAFFITNFRLANDSDYFSPSIDTIPLMHLWSLSIEEQFYIVYPLLTLFLWKWKRLFIGSLIVGALVSLALCVFFSEHHAATVFFHPATRSWELIFGIFIALAHRRGFEVRQLGSLLSIIGLSLILFSVFSFSKGDIYPGWKALLPTVGAACLIVSPPTAFMNRFILGRRLFVGIGLISYPLYLWHWPFVSFCTIILGEVSWLMGCVILALTTVAAFLTYRYLETPIRQKSGKGMAGKAMASLMLFSVFALGITGFLIRQKRIPPRL